MSRASKQSPKSAKSTEPAPSTPTPAAEHQGKRDAATVDLIEFNPTQSIGFSQPTRKADTAPASRHRAALWIFGLGVLILVGIVLIPGPGLYRDFKIWRATALALQAEEFAKNNQIEKANLSIRSAFMLAPDAPEVLRALAQLLTVLNQSNAMTYWNWLLQTSIATDDDRRAAAECAMHNGFYNEASTIIKDLLARRGGDARNQLLAARWSAQRGTPDQTMHFATSAVNDDPTYIPAVVFLAVLELDNPYLHQDGVNAFFHLADSDDDSGLVGMHYLALDPNLKPAEIDRLIARLHSHPLAGEFERIAALELEIKRHPGQRETLINQAVADQQNVAPFDLATFAEWLNAHNEASRVLKLIPRERALANKNLFTAYIDALGVLNRWTELKAVLTGATLPLEYPFVELYLSRCDGEMGDPRSSDLHWQNAVSAAAYNPSFSLHLAVYAEKQGQNDRAAAVYRSLLQQDNPAIARIASLGLLRVLSDQDTRSLCDLLDQMVSRWPRDIEMENQYVFLNLLLNEHVKEMHLRAVQLLTDDSNSISHHTNVALACLRLNDPAGALDAYNKISIDWKTAPLPDLIVYAATLNANGHTKAAHRLLVSVHRHDLRPELRDLIKSIP